MSTSLSLLACVALALFLLASPAKQQDAPPATVVPALVSLDLPLAKLADWGRREFEYRLAPDGPSLGSFVMETKVDKDVVTLHDRADLKMEGSVYWLEMTATGALGNLLRPTQLLAKGTTDDGDGKTFEFTADFTDKSAHVASAGKSKDKDVPAGTLTSMALPRILTLLPRRAGFATTYDRTMDADEMNVKPGGTITCVGQENVGPADHATKAWRFDVTSGQRTFLSAWVDDAGHLLRACLDGRKWIVAKD